MSQPLIPDVQQARLAAALQDRYQIERELGQGGMAIVYLALDLKHHRQVALKVLRPELGAILGADRFLQEIRVTAALQHPNILPLFDSGEAAGLLYYVMPFVEGESLRSRLERERELPIADTVALIRSVANALDYAHRKGVLHRDIKPENILLHEGQPMLADFGIALAVNRAGEERLTRSGLSIGTPQYRSPEQATGERDLGPASDTYSLGAVAYEMLVGEPPITGPSAAAIAARLLIEPPRGIRTVRTTVPRAIEAAVLKALAKVPADRFKTAAEFATALSGESAVASAGRRRPIQLSRTALIGGSIAVLLIAVAAFLLLGPFRSGTANPTVKLVVMPFKNLGGSEDTTLVDGLSRDLTDKFAGLSGLRVIASASALKYRNQSKTAGEIRSELGADYLIEGTAFWERRPGGADTVRVNARLVRTSDGESPWGNSYDLPPAQVFAMHSTIVSQVTGKLLIHTEADERRRVAERPTVNLEAHRLYQLGHASLFRSTSRQDLEAAVQFFDQAKQEDSEFAAAWALLGRAHVWIYTLGYDASQERLLQSKRAVDMALALSPDLPEAHLASGLYWSWGHGDYKLAMQEFQIANRLRPSDAEVAIQIGNIHRREGRFADAIAAYQRTAELDPRSHRAWLNLGETLLMTRRFSEVAEPLDRVIGLNPEYLEGYIQRARLEINWRGDLAAARAYVKLAEQRVPPGKWRPGNTDLARVVYHPDLASFLERVAPGAYGLDSASYHMLKAVVFTQLDSTAHARAHFDSARIRLEQLTKEHPDQMMLHAQLGQAYAGLGRADVAVAAARKPLERPTDAFGGPSWRVNLAQVYVLLGNYAQAAVYYDSALAVPSWISFRWLEADPLLAAFRRDPAFAALAARRRPAGPIANRGGSAGALAVHH